MPSKRLNERHHTSSHISHLADDTLRVVMQLLELRQAVDLAKSSSRFIGIFTRNRERLRQGYERWKLERPVGGIEIEGEHPIVKLVNAGISATPGHRSRRHRFNFLRITFEVFYDDPHFEIVTDTLVAHIRANYSEDLEFSCEVIQGKQSAAIAYIIDEAIKESLPNFGLDVCQWTNPEKEALLHLPATLEDIDIWFDHGHTFDIEGVVRFVEKMPALKKFKFVAAYQTVDFPRMFFDNAAVQKLSSIKFHSMINAEIDDELIQKFANTELYLEEGFTQVTWQGVRDAIQAWKQSKIPKLEWAFYVNEEEEEPAMIWKKLLGDVTHLHSTSQCIERSGIKKRKRNMSPTVESLDIKLLYYDLERKMQKIQIEPTKAEQAKR